MRKPAPWIAAGAGLALLVANLVVFTVLLGRPAPPKGGGDASAQLARDIEAVRLEQAAVRTELAAVRSTLRNVRDSLEDYIDAAPAEEPDPPPGSVVATFDRDLGGWNAPEWGSASLMRATRRGMYRRGRGALALGYVYGEGEPAALGPLDAEGEVKLVHLYAMTRAGTVRIAVGVVEEGGARYEVRLPLLHPREGWRLISVAAAAMTPAGDKRDPDGRLDRRKIESVYVADRSEIGQGGNVLLIDDVSVDASEE